MKRLLAIASLPLIIVTALHAAPDFWYVVPGETPATSAGSVVRGIVVPSAVRPTVQTTPAGSVISWRRPDGARQSFVVQGVNSLTFEPGPLAGTTYVPFVRSKFLEYDPRGCCACASWQNSVESVEALSCVVGCPGCGCEGCICSPTFPCPIGPDGATRLVAHNDPEATMTFVESGPEPGITLGRHGHTARFHGRRLSARVNSTGETVIDGLDSIALSGRVATRAIVKDDTALFAWSSPDASVILEQPRSMAAPSFRDGTIDLVMPPADALNTAAKRLAVEPVMDRCSACGTHPNSDGDLDIMDCVPGFSVCYRCVSWECVVPAS